MSHGDFYLHQYICELQEYQFIHYILNWNVARYYKVF